MKAYLIGGPEDMISMPVQERVCTLSFPHRESMAPIPMHAPPDELIEIRTVHYRKIYESHGRYRFAIFVHDPYPA